jgi:hypothetical protein
MLKRFFVPGIIVFGVFAIAVFVFVQSSLLLPIDSLKANCLKAIEHTVQNSAQPNSPSGAGNAERREVEYDCLVAEYTEKLARFTLWLVAATGVLGIGTFIAAVAAMLAAQHITIVERAFIHGGVHPDGRILAFEGDKIVGIRVKFSMANYGKTPGFIKSVRIGSGQLHQLADHPTFSKEIPVSDLYFPLMKMEEVRFPDDVEITIPADGEHVVFQRVFYDDIFGMPHSSGSLHLMYIDDQGVIRDKVVSGEKPRAQQTRIKNCTGLSSIQP